MNEEKGSEGEERRASEKPDEEDGRRNRELSGIDEETGGTTEDHCSKPDVRSIDNSGTDEFSIQRREGSSELSTTSERSKEGNLHLDSSEVERNPDSPDTTKINVPSKLDSKISPRTPSRGIKRSQG
jgi:hypothetical protein